MANSPSPKITTGRTLTGLAHLLRLYRVMKNIGVRELAKEIGTSGATISRIERGHIMDAETMLKIMNWMMTPAPTGEGGEP